MTQKLLRVLDLVTECAVGRESNFESVLRKRYKARRGLGARRRALDIRAAQVLALVIR